MDILSEALKIYPKGELRETTLSGGKKLHNRFFIGRHRTSFVEKELYNHIKQCKFNILIKLLCKLGYKYENISKREDSAYFGVYKNYKSIQKIRISDHECNFIRKQHYTHYIIISWNTNIWKVIDYITD